jgi:hypothetical protein
MVFHHTDKKDYIYENDELLERDRSWWNAALRSAHWRYRLAGHLSLIARYGKLWVVPGPPQAHLVGTQEMDVHLFLRNMVKYSGQGVLIELESPLVTAVRAQLDEWKRHYIK